MAEQFALPLGDERPPKARILIVDNEPSNVEFLHHVLELEGYGALTRSTDARDAADRLDQIRPDLILLDLMMPEFDGFQFMQRVREWLPEDDYIPIIVATADTAAETRRRALAAGASDFLTKPLSPAEVRLRVRNLIRTRFLHAQLRGQNSRLEERVHERTLELQDARQEILDRLARAAEFRDDDTGQHTQRVGRLAARIAEVVGLPAEEVSLIRKAAPLHDVGKIGIPDSILLKEGRLTPQERTLMQTHTTIGARILSGSRFPLLRLAEEIALSHHEHWDGAGYPSGLRDEDIPYSGRIVAVADVFDSLTHERPYKIAWSTKDALAEIRAQSGKQFDPVVVDAMLRVAPEVGVLEGIDRLHAGPEDEAERQIEERLEILLEEREKLNRRIRSLRRRIRGQDQDQEQEQDQPTAVPA